MSDALDKNLLQQYVEVLGTEGLAASLEAFSDLMPAYLLELQAFVSSRNEEAVRKQAHKIKGGCKSLGFVRLGAVMEEIERQPWEWEELEQRLVTWHDWLAEDDQAAQQWLAEQTTA